jgi:hypothetical protein
MTCRKNTGRCLSKAPNSCCNRSILVVSTIAMTVFEPVQLRALAERLAREQPVSASAGAFSLSPVRRSTMAGT